MDDDGRCGWRVIRLFGTVSVAIGIITGLATGDGFILILAVLVSVLMFALGLNDEMRSSQESGEYRKAWERWGAG